jgi:hypothetical protein
LYDFATTTSADLQRGYGGMLVDLLTWGSRLRRPEAVDLNLPGVIPNRPYLELPTVTRLRAVIVLLV